MPRITPLWIGFLAIWIAGCTKSAHTAPYINFSKEYSSPEFTATADPLIPPTRKPDQPVMTPTPNPPQPLPTLRTQDIQYTVQMGDTLKTIAQRFQLLPSDITEANQITNPNMIYAGQVLFLPAPRISKTGPDFKVIPDSELILSPYTVRFNTEAFIANQGGYLQDYQENVGLETYSGPEIVEQIALDFSVNPRLLLAVIEHQSRWVTTSQNKDSLYPLQYREAGYEGLYKQLAWAANELNRGYYLWKVQGVASWTLKDGTTVPIDETINAGTAGVQNLFSHLLAYSPWIETVSNAGLNATYQILFGYPFDFSFSPVVPDDLQQPELQLPFEKGVTWAFTGGPHGGWGNGSAWAALDFAPVRENQGCTLSNEWVVAAADGMIVRSDHGAVVQSLDGDPHLQTGWSLLYMHIETRDRVQVGSYLYAGEKIGHPSCEGGISSGSHVHLARRYNGEWIPADQEHPFVLEGWISGSSGSAYQGYLFREGVTLLADDRKTDTNQITR